MKRFRRWILLAGLAIAIFLLTAIAPQQIEVWLSSAHAETPTAIPTVPYAIGNQTVDLPDWSKISFSSLPAIQLDGSFELPSNLLDRLGYDPAVPGARDKRRISF
jgi:hypothetical protein